MYFAVVSAAGNFVVGQLALTASEALAFLTSVNGIQIEFRDDQGRSVGEDQLRNEAGQHGDTQRNMRSTVPSAKQGGSTELEIG